MVEKVFVRSSSMVSFPVAGLNQWVLAWLSGFKMCGLEIFYFEKSLWPGYCFDPRDGTSGDDCSYGVGVLEDYFERFQLGDRWCFVDSEGRSYGRSEAEANSILKSADVVVDLELNSYFDPPDTSGLTVLIDPEPAWTQMMMEKRRGEGVQLIEYDRYFTTGLNIGTEGNRAPTAGKQWTATLNPVLVSDYEYRQPVAGPFTTVMGWSSNRSVDFEGTVYGQKGDEFWKFKDLPGRVAVPLEIAVAGIGDDRKAVEEAGWRLASAHEVTLNLQSYREYIYASAGAFTVAKSVFVATNAGWFGDREGYYMAAGRPAVVQETGFSHHLPTGLGLFAAEDIDDAAEAIDEILDSPVDHSLAACALAHEYFDANKVVQRLLDAL